LTLYIFYANLLLTMNNNTSYYYQFKSSKLDKRLLNLDKQPAFDILYPRHLTPEDKEALSAIKQYERVA